MDQPLKNEKHKLYYKFVLFYFVFYRSLTFTPKF